jgi:D-glycero-D-manno-heptose 1,7-bisphosphate phosphatase
MTSAVFLDRDGVLNQKAAEGEYVTTWSQFRLLPGVAEALRELRRRDPTVRLIVITNQRGIALQKITLADIADIHTRLRARLASEGVGLDGIYVCPHGLDACDCRKPGVGLFRQALADLPDIDPQASAMVGDTLADLEAGHRMGCRIYLIGSLARRRRILEASAQRGLIVDGHAPSLRALVEQHPVVWPSPSS